MAVVLVLVAAAGDKLRAVRKRDKNPSSLPYPVFGVRSLPESFSPTIGYPASDHSGWRQVAFFLAPSSL